MVKTGRLEGKLGVAGKIILPLDLAYSMESGSMEPKRMPFFIGHPPYLPIISNSQKASNDSSQ